MTKATLTTGVCALCVALFSVACSDANSGAGNLDVGGPGTGNDDISNGPPVFSTDTSTSDTTGPEDGAAPVSDAVSCVPACGDKSCGDDGCGGACGACDEGLACDADGQCVCAPDCDGKTCGDDGCGGVCGTCSAPMACGDDDHCVCQPDCGERECGADGCGGSCGTCTDVEICSGAGSCVPDPEAGCLGLELAENWAGTFDGVYDIVVASGLIPASDGDTDGTLEFSITCLNSKFIVNGQVTGVASGDKPFEMTLTGTYNPTTGVLDGTVPEGHLDYEGTL
ncbi:MAG: hypothetical protein QF464_21310, partial [Myxococcota bacterium]|nr:hypothetical protein [Myxococcota bacterium]